MKQDESVGKHQKWNINLKRRIFSIIIIIVIIIIIIIIMIIAIITIIFIQGAFSQEWFSEQS